MSIPIFSLTPFEVFRTPIQIFRFTDGFYLNGIWQEGSQIIFSSNFLPGNVINLNVNSSPITQNYITSQTQTMQAIASQIMAISGVMQVNISADLNTLTIIPLPPNSSIVSNISISGGSSQPTFTMTNSPTIISATASVQPLGKDVKLVPEGRRDAAEFKFYTSTEIFGVTAQNPDQVTVLKSPFTGIVYEVISINDWQNNANFNITNHYKFIALRLHPLPGVL